MAEASLIMADDRVVPIAKIKRAVRAKFHIDRPEFAARRTNQRRTVFETKTRAIIDDIDAPNGVVDVAAENKATLPIVRPMRVGDKIAAGTFAAVATRPKQRRRVVTPIRNQARIRKNRRTIIAGEHDMFVPFIEDMTPGIL